LHRTGQHRFPSCPAGTKSPLRSRRRPWVSVFAQRLDIQLTRQCAAQFSELLLSANAVESLQSLANRVIQVSAGIRLSTVQQVRGYFDSNLSHFAHVTP